MVGLEEYLLKSTWLQLHNNSTQQRQMQNNIQQKKMAAKRTKNIEP